VTKRLESKFKISRRLGVALWGTAGDPFNTRNYKPGQHGAQGRRNVESDYAIQLLAKQKLKGYYANMSERQFRNVFKQARREKGDSGENLTGLLERRLDIIVYRMNLVPTVFAARQFVNHKHVLVNGKAVNIPSYRLEEGDVVEVREKSKQLAMVIEATQKMEREVPSYLEVDVNARKGKFLRVPKFAEIPYPVMMEPKLVIEFYSR
jgi:small subunit ribosomal protein S4